MNIDTYTVYVIALKNDMRYLYPKLVTSNDDFSVIDIMNEAQFALQIYEELYQPVRIISTFTNVLSYNINSLVIYNMHIYGIELIRGGKYSSKYLSDAEKEEISTHIKYFLESPYENYSRSETYYKYKKEYSNHQANDLLEEQMRLNKLISSYDTIKFKYDTVNIITKSDLDEIEWLKEMFETPDKCVNHRLWKLSTKIKEAYLYFKDNIFGADEKLISYQKSFAPIENMKKFLDEPFGYLFYIITNGKNKEKETVDAMISVIEIVLYSILNYAHELEFELKSFNNNEILDRQYVIKTFLCPNIM